MQRSTREGTRAPRCPAQPRTCSHRYGCTSDSISWSSSSSSARKLDESNEGETTGSPPTGMEELRVEPVEGREDMRFLSASDDRQPQQTAKVEEETRGLLAEFCTMLTVSQYIQYS